MLAAAERQAAAEKATLRELIEQGPRRVLAEKAERRPFQLRHPTFHSGGVMPEFQGASWEKIRSAIYLSPRWRNPLEG